MQTILEREEIREEISVRPRREHHPTKQAATAIAKGAAAGLVAGITASWVMTQFMSLMNRLTPQDKSQGGQSQAEEEPSTVELADRLSWALRGRPIPEQSRSAAGQMVHYGYGTLMGGVYGALCEMDKTSRVSVAAGVPWGVALWIAGDEIAVPALKLSRPPTEHPISVHVSAFAAHVVYGLCTDVIRRSLLRIM